MGVMTSESQERMRTNQVKGLTALEELFIGSGTKPPGEGTGLAVVQHCMSCGCAFIPSGRSASR